MHVGFWSTWNERECAPLESTTMSWALVGLSLVGGWV